MERTCEHCKNCKVTGFGQFWCSVRQEEIDPSAEVGDMFVLDDDYKEREE